MQNIYLIGASGHAKVIADLLESLNSVILGVFDRDANVQQMLQYEVKQQPSINQWPTNGFYLIAIGNNKIRKQIATLNKELEFTKTLHSNSTVSKYATIESGTVVMAGVTVNVNTIVGKHVILNTNCSIDHDCFIADYVHISPNAALAGNVKVGEGTHIGIGASVIQGIRIGKWATIGAGSVVIREVPDYAVVVGNPGKIIKYNTI